MTDQNYFIQRLCNKEKRFAKSAAYTYAAVAYIEKKQINRNINLAGTRGREVVSNDGGKTFDSSKKCFVPVKLYINPFCPVIKIN